MLEVLDMYGTRKLDGIMVNKNKYFIIGLFGVIIFGYLAINLVMLYDNYKNYIPSWYMKC